MPNQTSSNLSIQAKAHQEILTFGGGLETIVIASYVNQNGEAQERLFQWAHKASRIEGIKLISWALKNKRIVRFVPFIAE